MNVIRYLVGPKSEQYGHGKCIDNDIKNSLHSTH